MRPTPDASTDVQSQASITLDLELWRIPSFTRWLLGPAALHAMDKVAFIPMIGKGARQPLRDPFQGHTALPGSILVADGRPGWGVRRSR